MAFNENSRVKIPCILHLMRLGYAYLPLSAAQWDEQTNIFPEIFYKSLARFNPDMEQQGFKRVLAELILLLDNEDLGKSFYEKLTASSGCKLIDFSCPANNTFHVVTELTCKNGNEEFRPDITLLINGMPLVFIEVKKPNNHKGIIAERSRIIARCQNKAFRRFINITQFMIFSNNMEYVDGSPEPIEGAFYASPSYQAPAFNFFREEDKDLHKQPLLCLSEEEEKRVLLDTNLISIKGSPEFASNKNPTSPTNCICTSLLSRERLFFLLQYGLAYVRTTQGYQKHIMRYPQLFATRAIAQQLEAGARKGIVWHTQGSGKTALAYYNTCFLRDYFQKKGIISKFYFIVDRLDLLIQAQGEFVSRGLHAKTVNSRDEFAREIKSASAVHNDTGAAEITVVNIQKFKDDPQVVRAEDYALGVQRVYFLDEVHRSYKPSGSFLANLEQSDRQAIKIGLTGTPLLDKDSGTRALFGGYFHKYYYNASIADGYTLRLIREAIETNYQLALQEALAAVELQQGDIPRSMLYAHKQFVKPMLDYILHDFSQSRMAHGDDSIGAMVICDSSEQAKMMFELFNASLKERESTAHSAKRAALILHDIGSKEERKGWVADFKEGNIDILFVYNMLLTGFDAHRLKKLYLGRVIKEHNLLQALTRVNRPYKRFRYGYVVDFADIRKEFDEVNRAYLEELQNELGDEAETYSYLFKSQEEITQEMESIRQALFAFDTSNAEIFSQQISQIEDRDSMLVLKKALADARALYNIIRLQGQYDKLADMDFEKLNALYGVVNDHLALLNLKAQLSEEGNTKNLLNAALEDVIFLFTKIKEEELAIADKLKSTLRKTREAFLDNFDPQDPQFITLKEELERLFKKKKLNEVTQEDMTDNIDALNALQARITELNRTDSLLRTKYQGDVKYARVHKRLQEAHLLPDISLARALLAIKHQADEKVFQNIQFVDNETYFVKALAPVVISEFMKIEGAKLTAQQYKTINNLVVFEYIDECTSHNRTGAFA